MVNTFKGTFDENNNVIYGEEYKEYKVGLFGDNDGTRETYIFYLSELHQ